MSSRLSELIAFKEYWETRKEKCEDAVKFYNEEITKEINNPCESCGFINYCVCITKEEEKMKKVKVGQLVRWGDKKGKSVIGYVIDVKGDQYQAIFSDEVPLEHVPEYLYMDSEFLLDIYDVVVYKPKEEKLTVAQEASNFGYQAIQGIVSANEDKESQKYDVPQKKVPFTFSDFDTSVKRTWKDQDFKDAVSNASLGLTGEAGEVADLIKKAIYHGRHFIDVPAYNQLVDHDMLERAISREDVKDELSDVLFYVSAMAQEFGFTLEEVASHNKEKLAKRYEKGFTVEESAQKKDKLRREQF